VETASRYFGLLDGAAAATAGEPATGEASTGEASTGEASTGEASTGGGENVTRGSGSR
jgi:hypothetical protein